MYFRINDKQRSECKTITSVLLLSAVMVSLLSMPVQANQKKLKNTSKRPQPDQSIVFKSTPQGDLLINIFLPENVKQGEQRPAIVFFFGGGWVGGAPTQFYPHSRYLADRGIVAFSAEYRIKSKHKTSPFECVEDGKSAIRWVRENAARWNIDPNRIAAGGGSAGGHVASSTSLISGLDAKDENLKVRSTPDAMVLFNPVVDTTATGWVAGHKRLGDRSNELSSIHYINANTPATILFHGTADTAVPFENVERFQKLMKTQHNRCELFGYEDRKHGFFNFGKGNNEDYLDTVSKMDAFLVSLGWLSKP
ncbi:MAG: alpha/beta hydrolase fold domain-containing protein [Planctomycetaceae bacterium]|nr:alpha/beta hydrolase fold domain-containing protein [Planctomycetaceae bacterium]